MQNGMTHAAAGDIRAQEATGVLKTGDPAGFNLVDVRTVRTASQLACAC
jgi:photosystem I subunit V